MQYDTASRTDHYYGDFKHLNDGLCKFSFTTPDVFVSQGSVEIFST